MISSPADHRGVTGREEREESARPDGPATDYRAEADRLAREAQVYYARKRYVDAEQRVLQLLGLQEQVLGRNHPEYATGLSMLAELRFLQGDHAVAEPILREVVEIRRAALGERHPDHVSGLCCLAGLLGRIGKRDEAETHLRRALAIRREALGPDHPDTTWVRTELARWLRDRGDTAGADAILRPEADDPPTLTRVDHAESGVPDPIGIGVVATSEFGTDGAGWDDLSQEILAISNDYSDLGARLAATARQMASAGTPTPDEPPRSRDARRAFHDLRDEVRRRAESVQVPCPPIEALDALSDVAALLDVVRDAECRRATYQAAARRAMADLDRVLALSPKAGLDASVLRDCHDRARALRGAISASSWFDPHPSAGPLARGDHPFAKLLRLVEGRDALGDAAWAELHETVGAAFGRVLASAASRDRIVAPKAEPSPSSDPSPAPRTIPRGVLFDLARLNPIELPLAARLSLHPRPRPHPFRMLDEALAAEVEDRDIPAGLAESHPSVSRVADHPSPVPVTSPPPRMWKIPRACTVYISRGVVGGPLALDRSFAGRISSP